MALYYIGTGGCAPEPHLSSEAVRSLALSKFDSSETLQQFSNVLKSLLELVPKQRATPREALELLQETI